MDRHALLEGLRVLIRAENGSSLAELQCPFHIFGFGWIEGCSRPIRFLKFEIPGSIPADTTEGPESSLSTRADAIHSMNYERAISN